MQKRTANIIINDEHLVQNGTKCKTKSQKGKSNKPQMKTNHRPSRQNEAIENCQTKSDVVVVVVCDKCALACYHFGKLGEN